MLGTPSPLEPLTQGQRIALAAVLLLGLVLRLYGIHEESAWGDEALTTWCYPAESFASCMECVFGEDDRLKIAPVYYLVQWAWSVVAGGSLLALRMLSVCSGLATLLLVFHLGRRLFSVQAGLWAALLQALSLYMIYFDQEVRFYAFMLFLSAASCALFIDLERRTWKGWILYLALNTAILFTHSFAVFLFMAQGIALLITHERKVRLWFGWGVAHVAIALLLVGWVAWLHYDFDAQSEAYSDRPAGYREFAMGLLQYAGGRPTNEDPAPYMITGISFDRMHALIVFLLMGFGLAAAGARYYATPASASAARLWKNMLQVWCWFLVPYVGLYVLAMVWKPCFFPRYILYAVLPFPLLTGAAFTLLPRHGVFRSALAGVLLGTLLYQNFALTRPFRAGYQGMARLVAQDAPATTTVIGLKTYNFVATRYACAPGGYRVLEFQGFQEMIDAIPPEIGQGKVVWVVFDRWSKFAEFEAACTARQLHFEDYHTGGMPRLTVYRVWDGPAA